MFSIEGKKVEGDSEISAGGNVIFGDISGQMAIGKNITQTQTILDADKKELYENLIKFKD